ncbi:hypothetical protein [Desulfofalx alkaliphila]|uniref:hypothetical protein n=1 Tax=Desulfofalx alkaliphila TaxID=105483 RepID=UPI0004E184F4|nr:hypothetical protein [Desulfofalx alkaliphila]
MRIPDMLGMELDNAIIELKSTPFKAEIKTTGVTNSLSARGGTARIVRIDKVTEDKIFLTVTYHKAAGKEV